MTKYKDIKLKILLAVTITVMLIVFTIVATNITELKKMKDLNIDESSKQQEENEKNKEKAKMPKTNAKENKENSENNENNEITKNEEITENVAFTNVGKKKPYLTFNGKQEETDYLKVSEDEKSLSFKTPLFTNVGDRAVIHYWITNNNRERIKVEKLICQKVVNNDYRQSDSSNSKGLTAEQIEKAEKCLLVTPKNELQETIIKAGETTKNVGTVEIELTSIPTSNEDVIYYNITCKVNASRVER